MNTCPFCQIGTLYNLDKIAERLYYCDECSRSFIKKEVEGGCVLETTGFIVKEDPLKDYYGKKTYPMIQWSEQ